MNTAIYLKPHISEQTYSQAENQNVYVFKVPNDASKDQIKKSVEKQFKVTVEKVNVSVLKGKSKQSYRRRQQPIEGKRSDTKKAYVLLKSGDRIPVFEEIN